MIPTLPKWNDAQSVSLFLAALFSTVVTLLGVFHVVTPPGLTDQLMAVAGLAGTVIALAVNAWTHRSAHAQAVVATGVDGITTTPPVPPLA